MKTKQKVDFAIDLSLVFIGIINIILGISGFDKLKLLLIVIFGLYALINLLQFSLTNKSQDYEGLYTFLSSIVLAIICFFIELNKVNNLAIIIMAWVIMMSVIKFIKTDYYNDRRDKMWKIRIFTLITFIVIGILTSISLNYNINTQILVLGYFFFIHGILELIDPLTKYLIGK